MNNSLLLGAVALFCSLFLLGTAACLPLYKWNLKAFLGSSLWTKVYWWIPIFGIFLTVLYVKLVAAVALLIILAVFAVQEYSRRKFPGKLDGLSYLVIVCGCLCSLALFFITPGTDATTSLIIICFSSVLSDVCAFFFGNYIGHHPLPSAVNSKKSWEGVGGQMIGGLLGATLVAVLPLINLDLTLGFAVGVASACGDLLNSYYKRRLGIKDWGSTIPGHGGILDRCSSLSFALVVGYLLLLAR